MGNDYYAARRDWSGKRRERERDRCTKNGIGERRKKGGE